MSTMKPIVLIVVSLIIGFTSGFITATIEYLPISISAFNNSNSEHSKYREKAAKPKNTQPKKPLLEEELLVANQKINDLTKFNHLLSYQIEQMNIPIPASTTYLELLDRIDLLPATLIKQELSGLFDDAYASSVVDPHKFSKELIEIALSNDKNEITSGAVRVVFSYSPVKGWREFGDVVEIDQFDTVYAHFSPTQDIRNSVVKWQHYNTGEIIYLKNFDLSANNQSQYSVVRPKSGWSAGYYQVTVYDMNNDKQRVGGNTFYVSTVRSIEGITSANTPDHDVVQDLIMTGQAVTKIE